MNQAELCKKELTILFGLQIDKLSAITQYLLSIKTAIAENNINNLKQLILEEKLTLDEVEHLENERTAIFKKYNLSTDKNDILENIQIIDKNGSLPRLWQQLKTVMDDLEKAMEISKILLSHGQTRVRQSLSLLTGRPQVSKTYSSEGKESEYSAKRSIAVA